jgi:purine nucleoside permease
MRPPPLRVVFDEHPFEPILRIIVGGRRSTIEYDTQMPILRFILALLTFAAISPIANAADRKIQVRVVVVTMFERGADTGDDPGEFQFWVEREKLDRIIPFPQAYHDLRMNTHGVLGMVTGMGTARAAASVMALGLDPRFDLTHAYWVVAGIAGVNPAAASIGSAAWAEWVVDGDLAHEIDAREIPADWSTGIIPLRKNRPYELPKGPPEGEAYHLDPLLTEWAYHLTKDVVLDDNPDIRREREKFAGENARRPPFILKGDTLSASTFWHGKLLNQWAIDWVKYHTDGHGSYVTTAMEDTGTLQSLTWLAKAGKVDVNRVLVLRTASDYDQQPPGMTAAESLAATKIGKYVAYIPALEAAYRVGSRVVDEIAGNWGKYREVAPGGKVARQ